MTPTQPNAVWAGSYATSTINVAVTSGFLGTVALTDSVPDGLSCIVSPTNITNGAATVLCEALSAGNYVLIVTGTTGVISHSTSLTFTVEDFGVAVSRPASNSGFSSGHSVNSTITITALNGFRGSVILTGSPPSPITCVVAPANVVAGSGTETLSCKAPDNTVISGIIQLTVTGTSGFLSRAVYVSWSCQNVCSGI